VAEHEVVLATGVAVAALIAPSTIPAAFGQGPSFTPDLRSGQLPGTTITWRVTPGGALRSYQFSVAKDGGPYEVLNDFSPLNAFPWTPIDEGQYSVKVIVRTGLGTFELAQPYTIRSRVISEAVVTPTSHPLVAIYTAPSCAAGQEVFVEISPAGSTAWTPTNRKPCATGRTTSFWVGGMRAETVYRMRHAVGSGDAVARSWPVQFTTGPVNLPSQGFQVLDAPDAASWTEGIVMHATLDLWRSDRNFPVATDLFGRVVWYFDKLLGVAGAFPYLTRPIPGGTFLLMTSCCLGDFVLAEIDLAGNPVRRTTMSRINQQLQARGDQTVGSLHHDAVRLPNGQTLVLGMIERAIAGHAEPSIGDLIVALDRNLQVVWTWNSFEHLDVNRRAVLGETCWEAYGPACTASSRNAHDWLHSNSIAYSPDDHNLIVSMRHQDWVIKIDYEDGTGTGDVIWRLGRDGDFELTSSDPWPWFSHQHDASYAGKDMILLYDNGNTRCASAVGPCNSRGQVYRINEAAKTAELLFNADLGVYSDRLGSAQMLRNGGAGFGSGYLTPGLVSLISEIRPNGQTSYALLNATTSYRSFRMRTLYEP
jgi:arylsulfate sulfotransferase